MSDNEWLKPGAKIPGSMISRTFIVTVTSGRADNLPSEQEVYNVVHSGYASNERMVDVMHAEPSEREYAFRALDGGNYVSIRDTDGPGSARRLAMIISEAHFAVYSRYTANSKNWIRL